MNYAKLTLAAALIAGVLLYVRRKRRKVGNDLNHALHARVSRNEPRNDSICRPFIERQIALAEPRLVLVLGNFAARFFFGETGTIHALRGKWREIGAGGHAVQAMATLHPQELLAAPASKALAWMDLLAFSERVNPSQNG